MNSREVVLTKRNIAVLENAAIVIADDVAVAAAQKPAQVQLMACAIVIMGRQLTACNSKVTKEEHRTIVTKTK